MQISSHFRSIIKIFKSVCNKFGISLNKLETFVEIQTNRIGVNSAAEVFSLYIKNFNQTRGDEELSKFIDFYINNWKFSSSQWSQDIFVMYSTGKKKGGKYLEIGGADGYTHSNTISLNKYLNWDGILVEPDNEMFATLKQIRTKDKVLNCAISPSGLEESLTLRKVGQLSALLGYEGNDMHFDTRLSSEKQQDIKCISLNSLLKENKFDYFSLDVEGAELLILQSIDWNKINKPCLLTLEYNFREEDKHAIITILENQGYKNCFPNHDWIRRGDLWFQLS